MNDLVKLARSYTQHQSSSSMELNLSVPSELQFHQLNASYEYLQSVQSGKLNIVALEYKVHEIQQLIDSRDARGNEIAFLKETLGAE